MIEKGDMKREKVKVKANKQNKQKKVRVGRYYGVERTNREVGEKEE